MDKVDIVIDEILNRKIKDCQGCIYKASSQRHHSCLQSYFDDIYAKEIINELDCSESEREWLKKWLMNVKDTWNR